MRRPFRALVAFLPRLGSNWLTLFGSIIVSVSAATMLAALAIDLTSSGLNAYASAVIFLVLPGTMAMGLVLIPVGLVMERRRLARSSVSGGGAPAEDPASLQAAFAVAFQSSTVRRRLGFLLLMTGLNVLVFSSVTYKAVTFMETPRFCGTVCHKVMQPEFDAYNTSAHSHVTCVDCHVGSGASSTLKAKLSGLRQVWGVLTDHYPRPIPTPVHNLRPASETCEKCHQPGLPGASKLGFRVHFKKDKENTPQVTALLFHTGGKDKKTGRWSGIHWHTSDQFKVRYEVMDDKRQTIGKIQVFENGKLSKEFLPVKPASGAVMGLRTMDCVDCHNRATHSYDGTAEQAVERALADGRLDRTVPWLDEVATSVLKEAAPSRAQAASYFEAALAEGYKRLHGTEKPDLPAMTKAAGGLTKLYERNVYPDMNLSWDTYPSLLGHGGPDPGNTKAQCFRCHSGDYQTAQGEAVSSKCELCHEVMLKDELPADLPDEIRPLLQL